MILALAIDTLAIRTLIVITTVRVMTDMVITLTAWQEAIASSPAALCAEFCGCVTPVVMETVAVSSTVWGAGKINTNLVVCFRRRKIKSV
jgi:hypothetical protein